MNALLSLHQAVFARLERLSTTILPLLARLVFAGVLVGYYWQSAVTKLGDGVLGIVRPSLGAYAQIFPRTMEAISYDVSQLGTFHWLVVVAGTWAEFILPALIVVGLLTRLSALGMIGFIVLQSWVDIYGHGVDATTIGAWFDTDPSSIILDQRALWIFPLLYLVFCGAGPLSVDRFVLHRSEPDG